MNQPITPATIDSLLKEKAPYLSNEQRLKHVSAITIAAFASLLDQILETDEEKELAVETFKLASSNQENLVKYTEILSARIREYSEERRQLIQNQYQAFIEDACNKISTQTIND